jgi:parvulin-like peptidyl-prolyl isomerase
MIAVMRKLAHSTLYRIFLWVFLFMMAFGSGLMFIGTSQEDKNWVIKVYKKSITQSKFKDMLLIAKQQREMYRRRGFALAHEHIEKETVQAGVSSLLAQDAMDNLHLMIPNDFLQTSMQHKLQQVLPQCIKENGKVDEDMLRQAIAPHSIQDLSDDIEMELKNRVLYGLVDAAVYTPKFQLRLAYDAEFADKKYSYLTFSPSGYFSEVSKEVPSDEALASFYRKPEIADQFRTVERRAGVIWTFQPQHFLPEISESEVKTFYEKNKMQRYVLEPAKMQVRSLLIKIEDDSQAKKQVDDLYQQAQQDPSSFAKLVSKFSQDPKIASHAGLSEFFARTDSKMESVIVDTAFEQLNNDGQITMPIKTSRGYEILQRVKKLNTVYKEFKSVESEIKKELADEKFKRRFAQDAARVVSAAKYNPESLNNFVQRYKGLKSEMALDVLKSGLESSNLFRVEQGRYTSFVGKDKGYILQCTQVEKSKLPSLDQVKSKVLSVYFKEQAQKMMQRKLAAAFADAKTMNFDAVASKYGLSVSKASYKYQDGKAEQSAILKDQDVQTQAKMMCFAGALAAIQTKTDGILLQLDHIAPVDAEQLNEQKAHLDKVVHYTKVYQIKDGFIASLYRTAKLNNKIEIKKEVLQKNKEV